jgi:predicted extracellular nuclease
MNIRSFLLILLFSFSGLFCYAQNDKIAGSVMFYNVENLFDIEDDPLTADEEFLPAGDRRWNGYRMQAKFTSIAKVIANTGNWQPPAVIGLCEIENRGVLERLVNQQAIRSWKYKIIHKNSPDERGIDVAAIYRDDVFKPIQYRYFSPVPESENVPATREILYVSGVFAFSDTVHLFFNHWPSRYGGLMETRHARNKAASRLRDEVEKLQNSFHEPLIIIMGDFNDQPEDDSMAEYLKALPEKGNSSRKLYNLSFSWQKQGKGTLKHQSVWNVFDQIVVSGSLLSPPIKSLFTLAEDATIMESAFLFTNDDRYTGKKLFRTYEGYRYKGGFSDHLPVILKLRNGNKGSQY